MPSVFWLADGAGDVGGTPNVLIRWIRTQAPTLVVYGGDVYDSGTDEEFAQFFDQMDRNVADLCEVAGNHDWESRSTKPATGEIPRPYEAFWTRFPPPLSQQPIDSTRRGGARYDHVKDIGGWRLIFLDTGPCKFNPWPIGDPSRAQWLRDKLTATPGRAKIVFAHHSRLSRGKHGDVEDVEPLWDALFDSATNAPLASLTVAGHDHNVSLYGPRPRQHPENGSVPFASGIHVLVNGAGGLGHDLPIFGTAPDLFKDNRNFCVTRIDLVSPTVADVSILSFGGNDPPTVSAPTKVKTLRIQI